MLFLRVILAVILMLLASTTAGQILESLSSALNVKDNTTLENCKNIRDFEPCLKNTCPGYMPCYCKEEKEYCRCTNFKGPLGDYWNLGPKCEQQWNTRDLILVAVVPGICLALIISVCTYCIYSCKKWKHQANAQKRQELTASKTKPKHPMVISNHQNKAFLNDEDDYQFLSGQQQTMVYPPRIPKANTGQMEHIRNTQIMPIPKANFSYHQPEPNIVEENFSPSMRHASSSYYEDQHSIPQFRPVNGYPEQDTWVAPAISFKRPEINGIRVLPPIGSGQSFGVGQLQKDPGYQQFHNPARYGRAQY
ncbi:uncharacterized protein zgc:158432 [Scyliorhinus canicula]|uniref:uncharacterized protein zgc:158432 n=1 Tax=Scyliorhinus canicula TaxID=7830 RepID=UPI0018F59148|nr:uncharacterized protein zgc:158432 [Scyliorhinus canicula]